MKTKLKEVLQVIDKKSGFVERNKKAVWIFKLEKDYEYKTTLQTAAFNSKWLTIDNAGKFTVKKGYAWDGCSIKINILDLFIIGTPDGIINIKTMKPKTYYASLLHDALYQYMFYHSITRKQTDRLFYEILKENQFLLRMIYYFAVRTIGWISFVGKKRKMRKRRIKG